MVLLLYCGSSQAQDAHPAFRQYTVEDGLASSEVYQVKQDSHGFIWFATGNGVSRFNGYEFENYSMSNGLLDNTVFEIFEDKTERVWFVPISCKLSYYYKGKIYPFDYNDTLQKILRNSIKTGFCVDEKGTVFLSVSRDGIYEISKDGKIKHHFEIPDTVISLRVIEPVSGSFVYANSSKVRDMGLMYFNTEKLKDTVYFSGKSDTPINTRIVSRKSNSFVFSIADRLYIIKGTNEIDRYEFPNVINWINEDRDGDLWIGTLLGGVYHVQNDDFKNKKCYLPNISVDGVLQDREGGFWFATEGNAVYYSPSKEILTYDKSAGLSDNRVNCLTTDGSNVYIGTQDGYIYSIDKQGKTRSFNFNFNGRQPNGINGIFYDIQSGNTWFSGNTQSRFLEHDKSKSLFARNGFNRLLYDQEKNTYWVAYANGLRIKKGNQPVTDIYNNGKPVRRSNAVLKKNRDTLLLGSMDGLWEVNTNNYTFTYRGSEDTLLRNRILDLAWTRDGLLVIATKGAGLLVYDHKKGYQINVARGLSGDNVYRICIDSSVIWAATNKGLSKITISSKDPFVYEVSKFTTEDGLASNEINDVLKANGKIWVATNKGVSFFNPLYPYKTSTELPVYINRISINERDTALQGKYALEYDQNNIRINFIALGYKNAGQLSYRYKMIGLDTGWIYTKNREIQFTTLPTSNYKFILSVMKSNGEWSKNEAEVEFHIYAPFWQKWWFKLILVSAVLYAIIFLLRYRHRISQEQKEKSSELNRSLLNLKLKALRAQMNPHFIFNVMNSIQLFIVNQDDEATNRYLSKFSKLIRAILSNSDKNTIPLSEELKTLELYLDLEVMRFERKFHYEIIVDKQIDPNEIEIPPMLIQPYLENSLKHGILPARREGKIRIEIQKNSAFLKCIIEDNGIGRARSAEINSHSEYKSFGTSITKERLSVINELYNSTLSEQTIDLEDEASNSAGTRVEIHIPII
jgi:ligand-binding sensor domain-containing protein